MEELIEIVFGPIVEGVVEVFGEIISGMVPRPGDSRIQPTLGYYLAGNGCSPPAPLEAPHSSQEKPKCAPADVGEFLFESLFHVDDVVGLFSAVDHLPIHAVAAILHHF